MAADNDRDLFAVINVFHSTSLEKSSVRQIAVFVDTGLCV